ncbi:MAG: hypothetical protein ACI8RY_001008 [Urechidicola sp.]|jgi:hypothetical protein|tara:strand:- start:1116 stop:1838 length:723 start_codon:yes stop_codon:yes gene_type:complete
MIKNLLMLLTVFSLLLCSCNNEEIVPEVPIGNHEVGLNNKIEIDTVYEQGKLRWTFHFEVSKLDTSLIYTLKYYSNGAIEDSIFTDTKRKFVYWFNYDSISQKLVKIKEKKENTGVLNQEVFINSNGKVIRKKGKYAVILPFNRKQFIFESYDESIPGQITEYKIRLGEYDSKYNLISDSSSKLIYTKSIDTIKTNELNGFNRFYTEIHFIEKDKSYHVPIACYFDPIDSIPSIISSYWR